MTINFMNILLTLVIASPKSVFVVLKSFPYENHCKCYKKLVSKLLLVLFILTLYILRDYSGVRIGFNMINKRHALSIVYTMLV